jgi:hypothetical protein
MSRPLGRLLTSAQDSFGDLITDLMAGVFVVSWIEELIRRGLGSLPGVSGYGSAIAGASAFLVVSCLRLSSPIWRQRASRFARPGERRC